MAARPGSTGLPSTWRGRSACGSRAGAPAAAGQRTGRSRPASCPTTPTETPTDNPDQRTVWNVRDSDATLIVLPPDGTESPGTRLTRETAEALGRPLFVMEQDDRKSVQDWLESLGTGVSLNVAGPREIEAPGSYARTRRLLRDLLG